MILILIPSILLIIIAFISKRIGDKKRKEQENYSEVDKIWAWQETYIVDCAASFGLFFGIIGILVCIYDYLTK